MDFSCGTIDDKLWLDALGIIFVNIHTDSCVCFNNGFFQSGGNTLTGTIPSEFGFLSDLGTFDIGKFCWF